MNSQSGQPSSPESMLQPGLPRSAFDPHTPNNYLHLESVDGMKTRRIRLKGPNTPHDRISNDPVHEPQSVPQCRFGLKDVRDRPEFGFTPGKHRLERFPDPNPGPEHVPHNSDVVVHGDVRKAFDHLNRDAFLDRLLSKIGPGGLFNTWKSLFLNTSAVLQTP